MIIFPLITFPYVTRVLSPSGLGIYNFSNSIVSYFVLLAGLGIETYSIREGARIRDDRKKFDVFASEVFSINVISMMFSYMCLAVLLLVADSLMEYRLPIILFGMMLFFNTISVAWIFGIYEDYFYITIRGAIVQLISLILLFVFVKSSDDIIKYILISVFSNGGAYIFNWFYAKKYCNIRFVFKWGIFKHLKPVLLIFSTSIATMVYINSDSVMLGLICGDYEVGIYSAACKIYNVIKTVLNSFVPVFMARLSYEYFNDNEAYKVTFNYAFGLETILAVPMAIGAIFYSGDLITLIAGDEYATATIPMVVLFFSMFFATLGNLFSSGALLIIGEERYMLLATIVGATVNIVTNFFLIPHFGAAAAAFTTLCTEMIVFSILLFNLKRYINVPIDIVHLVKCVIASVPFIFISNYVHGIADNGVIVLVSIGVCAIVYFVILLILRDTIAIKLAQTVWLKHLKGAKN